VQVGRPRDRRHGISPGSERALDVGDDFSDVGAVQEPGATAGGPGAEDDAGELIHAEALVDIPRGEPRSRLTGPTPLLLEPLDQLVVQAG
jgi:hypothetical protein